VEHNTADSDQQHTKARIRERGSNPQIEKEGAEPYTSNGEEMKQKK